MYRALFLFERRENILFQSFRRADRREFFYQDRVKFALVGEPTGKFRVFAGKCQRFAKSRIGFIRAMSSERAQIYLGLFSGHFNPPGSGLLGSGTILLVSFSKVMANARLNCSFPRESRDITVPIGTP